MVLRRRWSDLTHFFAVGPRLGYIPSIYVAEDVGRTSYWSPWGWMSPLSGGYYANIFTHYRPIGDPNWYKKENPEGTPEPLLDVGECKLTGKVDQYSQGAVTCDNPAIGVHLSPTMFEAKDGADLFQWWKSVGPEEEEISVDADVGGGDEL